MPESVHCNAHLLSLSLSFPSSLSIARSFRALFRALSISLSLSLSDLLSLLYSAQQRDGDAALALRSLNLSHQLCGNRRRFRFVSRCISCRRHHRLRHRRRRRRRCVVSFRDVLEHPLSLCPLSASRTLVSVSALLCLVGARARVGVLGRQRLRLRSDCAASRYTLRSNVYIILLLFFTFVVCFVQ